MFEIKGARSHAERINMYLLRMKDLTDLYGLSKSTVNYWRTQGRFPDPLQLGPATIAWRRTDIEAWLSSCERVDANNGNKESS